jgi:hypothetical protein
MPDRYAVRRLEWCPDRECWLDDGLEDDRFATEAEAVADAVRRVQESPGFAWDPVVVREIVKRSA